MTEAEVYDGLTEIFHDLFADPSLALKPTTTAADVAGWDSFNHINIVAAAEERFKVRFTTREVDAFDNVGALVTAIVTKAR